MSYDNILLFSIFYGLYIIAFVFAANFVKTEYRKSEDEAKKYEYLKDSELHDGKKNVYQRIIDDKYFDYARYIKMQDKKLQDLGANSQTKIPLGSEELEGLKLYCLLKQSSGYCGCFSKKKQNLIDENNNDDEDYQQNENLCSICHSDVNDGNYGILQHPSCNHKFHWECIEAWFNVNNNCPICRTDTRKGMVKKALGLRSG